MEAFLIGVTRTITHFVFKYWVIYLILILAYLFMTFRHRIDYFFMKKDQVWRKWYRGVFRCPACLRKLKPDDYPPNYRCPKCGNTYAFGDRATKEWINSKPLITKGEFFRYISLLSFLAIGALWLFYSGVLG